MIDTPLSWKVWHPHQGLWNKRVLRGFDRVLPPRLHRLARTTLISTDTIILWTKALLRRAGRLGPTGFRAVRRAPAAVPVLYFDLGTHKSAGELVWMLDGILPRLAERYDAYAFEACPPYFEEARRHLAGRANVTILNTALVHQVPEGGRIALYEGAGEGLGTSLYRTSSARTEVDAVRFTEWLRRTGLDLRHSVCLLRMNIEGAEYEVISDLVERGLTDCFDGYYGMWDDVLKIDAGRDREFRRTLATHRIRPLTFNGRDLPFRWRMRCIAYDVQTSVEAGLRRVERTSRAERSRGPHDGECEISPAERVAT